MNKIRLAKITQRWFARQTINQKEMKTRILKKIEILDEFASLKDATPLKAKLTDDQIAYVDLLYESIFVNSSEHDIQMFRNYVTNQGLQTMAPEELFYDTFGAKKEDLLHLKDEEDMVESFVTDATKFNEKFSDIDFSGFGSSSGSPAEAKVEEPVAADAAPKV